MNKTNGIMNRLGITNGIRLSSIVLLLALSFASCTENEIKPDYSSFLKIDYPTFKGKIDGQSISWNYGIAQFQMTTGLQAMTCNDPNDFSRYAVFGLMSDDNLNRVMFYSPIFDIRNPNWYEGLFKQEKKEIGTFSEEFSLVVIRDGKLVRSSSFAKGQLEVLKTQEFMDPFYKTSLRVWLRLSSKLTSCECTHDMTTLTDGLMVAEFWNYKNLK
jgi:hypothetical protein